MRRRRKYFPIIPTNKNKNFYTSIDNQTSIPIRVYEGERSRSIDNNLLGEFVFEGIPRAPKGVSSIKVCFNIGADGILDVSAKDRMMGQVKKMSLTYENGRLTNDEIEKMLKDTVKYKQEDEEFMKKADAMLDLDHCAYAMRDMMSNYKNADAGDQKKIVDAFEGVIKWLKSNRSAEVDEYEVKLKELQSIWNPIMAKMNKL